MLRFCLRICLRTGLLFSAVLLGALLVGMPAAVWAQPVQVEAYLDADSLRVGERATLWMVVEHSFQSQVSFPPPDAGPTLFGDLEVLGQAASGHRYAGTARPGGRVDSVGYAVTTFVLDEARVPPLPAWVVTGEDTTIAGSRAFAVPVPSVLPSDTTTAMQPLMPPVDFPYGWRMWAAASALVALLLALGLWGYKRRDRWVPSGASTDADAHTTPYSHAQAALDALAAPADGEPSKAFYIDLTDAVRTYLRNRLHMPAHERTSAEVVRALKQHPRVPQQAAGRIQAVLELADLAKFADTRPDAAANRTALRETKQALEEIEQSLDETAVADETNTAEAGENGPPEAESFASP